MRLTLQQLETFYWIARLGNFHAAARHLNLTQPSVSGRIKELERTLGTELFDRSVGGRVRLTPSGRAIQQQAEQMLDLAQAVQQQAGAANPGGLIRLGVVETVAHLALPGLMAALKQRRPALKLELSVDVGAALIAQLEDHQIDLAITTETTRIDGGRVDALGEIDLAWVGPASHPLTGTVLTPADLKGETIFTQPPQSTIGRTITTWFAAEAQVPGTLNTCNSLSIIIELVVAGLGFAIITPALLRKDQASLVQRFESAPPIPARTLSAVSIRRTWSDDTAFVVQFLADALRQVGALR